MTDRIRHVRFQRPVPDSRGRYLLVCLLQRHAVTTAMRPRVSHRRITIGASGRKPSGNCFAGVPARHPGPVVEHRVGRLVVRVAVPATHRASNHAVYDNDWAIRSTRKSLR